MRLGKYLRERSGLFWLKACACLCVLSALRKCTSCSDSEAFGNSICSSKRNDLKRKGNNLLYAPYGLLG